MCLFLQRRIFQAGFAPFGFKGGQVVLDGVSFGFNCSYGLEVVFSLAQIFQAQIQVASRPSGVGVLEALPNFFAKVGEIRPLNGLRFQQLLQALNFTFGLRGSVLRVGRNIRDEKKAGEGQDSKAYQQIVLGGHVIS